MFFMAGHSHYANIARKKSVTDAKRGKVFTKLVREITIAARLGGSNPDMNARLRTAFAAARAQSVPIDTIERAAKKGAGELESEALIECTYEGYGAGGVAIIVDAVTNNRHRTAADVRSLFTKNNGNMGEPNSVSWGFDPCGLILIAKKSTSEDQLMEVALGAGATDIKDTPTHFEVITPPNELEPIKAAIEKGGLKVESAENVKLAKNTVRVEGETAQDVLDLIEALDDNDDVQKVYSNADFAPEFLAKLGS